MKRLASIYLAGFLSCGLVLVLVAATHSPTRAVSDRDVYYPASEDLAPDEMRVVALGTGMPSARPKQAAACWLVELGNGDKFLFDIGSGCHERRRSPTTSSTRCSSGTCTSITWATFPPSGSVARP
jgi:hypothetical protein